MWGKQQAGGHIQCSLTKAPTIYLDSTPRQKITILMGEYTHQEWIGYLVGRLPEKDNIFVEDLVIPPHEEVSSASATAEPFHVPEHCVGVIHSHHSMGAFHSGTDQSFVDMNFPVSITVAMQGGELTFDAVSNRLTPCNKTITLKCLVKFVQPQPLFNKEEWLKEAKENIAKGNRVTLEYNPFNKGVSRAFLGDTGRVFSQDLLKTQENKENKRSWFRTKDGKFTRPGEESKGFVVDSSGIVLTQKELEEHYKEIWED